jgi:hypothetical protein
LYASGNLQGKAYALTDIKKLDPQRFAELAAALAKSNDKGKAMRSCIGFHEHSVMWQNKSIKGVWY